MRRWRKKRETPQTNIKEDEEDGNNRHKQEDELEHSFCRRGAKERVLLCGLAVVWKGGDGIGRFPLFECCCLGGLSGRGFAVGVVAEVLFLALFLCCDPLSPSWAFF